VKHDYNRVNALEIFIAQGYRKVMCYGKNKAPVIYSLCLGIILLSGCASSSMVKVDPYASFHDQLLPNYTDVIIESEQEIFTLVEPRLQV